MANAELLSKIIALQQVADDMESRGHPPTPEEVDHAILSAKADILGGEVVTFRPGSEQRGGVGVGRRARMAALIYGEIADELEEARQELVAKAEAAADVKVRRSLFSVEALAQVAGVPRATLYRWIAERKARNG